MAYTSCLYCLSGNIRILQKISSISITRNNRMKIQNKFVFLNILGDTLLPYIKVSAHFSVHVNICVLQRYHSKEWSYFDAYVEYSVIKSVKICLDTPEYILKWVVCWDILRKWVYTMCWTAPTCCEWSEFRTPPRLCQAE